MISSAQCRDFLRYAGHDDAPIEVVSLVEAILADAIAAARTQWAEFEVDEAILLRRLGCACVACKVRVDALPQWLSTLCFSDLYFVCALELGLGEAVATFAARFVAPAVRSLRTKEPGDELQQMVLERLLVAGAGQLPRISSYTGRGSLIGWVRVVAARMSIDLRTGSSPLDSAYPLREVDELATTFLGPDIEMRILSGRYREQLRGALAAAFSSLSARDRNLLRFHFLEGVSGDGLARMYSVSRRTVTRWIEESRTAVLAHMRSRLAADLKLGQEELDGVIQDLRSQLESVVHASLTSRNKPS